MSRELIAVRKSITIERMRSYSGEDNIHGNDEAGQAWGLGGALVQGGQLVGYLNEMMTLTLGAGFLRGGEIAVSFVQPVRTGDVLVSGGTMTGEQYIDGRLRLDYEIWLTNQNGQKVTVGKASGWARQE